MPTDVVSASPLSADRLTRGVRKDVLEVARFRFGHEVPGIVVQYRFTFPARPPETAVDDGGSKEPLSDEDPNRRHACVAQDRLGSPFREPCWGPAV